MNELTRMRPHVLRWIERARVAPGTYRYTLADRHEPVLYNTLYAVLALEFFDALDELGPEERSATLERIRSFQDPATGYFVDPTVRYAGASPHSPEYTRWHLTGTALQALDALGSRPAHPLRYLEDYRSPPEIGAWLSGLDMRDSWQDSNPIMSLLGSLYFQYDWSGDEEWLGPYHRVLDWLDEVQDPRTGLWGTDHGSGLLRGMAAAYHFLMFYFAVGRPIPHMERMIDSTLKLQVAEGHFLPFGGSSCLDLDAIEVLVGLSTRTEHRISDVREAGARLYRSIAAARNPDGGFAEHSVSAFRASHLVPLAFSLARHGCRRTYGFQTRQLVKHTLLRSRRMYSGSIVQCSSGMYESTVWCAWFRPLAMAVVADRFPGDYPDREGFRPRYRRLPGLGYSGVAALAGRP